MARTRHLPIWRTAFDLAAHLERCVARFSRAHKYALGSELRQTSRRLCRLVTRANAARAEQRVRVLNELVLAVGSYRQGRAATSEAQRIVLGNAAFVYNAASVPIAAGVLYPVFGLLLSPILAATAMALSSVSVIGNALRLGRTPL